MLLKKRTHTLKAHLIIPKLSRADLAEFMLKQIANDTFLPKTPEVMYCIRFLLRRNSHGTES